MPGQRDGYKQKLAWDNLFTSGPTHDAYLQHYLHGPTIKVRCTPFTITSNEQVQLFYKTTQGFWESMETTPFALSEPVDDQTLHLYIEIHMQCFLTAARSGSSWLDNVLTHASQYIEVRPVLSVSSIDLLIFVQGFSRSRSAAYLDCSPTPH